jgi:2-polyprenyl-3-methyl-5-hydroxy-6-metoxy-1,4-benzoquinol methylase
MERRVAEFWEANPCGDQQVGGLRSNYLEFFDRYDEYRYTKESHILGCLDAIDWEGKDVLEIGLGQGADAEQIVRRGARWSGLDLTEEAVSRTRTRLEMRELDFNVIECASVLNAPFDTNSFDIIFSHGVLHHVPEIVQAQRELHRMIRPDGELIVMLYAKRSLNYLVSIALLRRIGLAAMVALGREGEGIYADHVTAAKEVGLRRYLRMENFIHHNTDGPHNPYSKVYDRATVERDFPDFEIRRMYKRFLDAPPLPVTNWPGGSVLGWHLWVHLTPR